MFGCAVDLLPGCATLPYMATHTPMLQVTGFTTTDIFWTGLRGQLKAVEHWLPRTYNMCQHRNFLFYLLLKSYTSTQ